MSYHALKVILVGNGGVGKTSLVQRFIKGEFITDYSATIGVDVFKKEITYNGDTVNLSIWDVAGQDKYNFMRKNFYFGADGVILIFDLTSQQSFVDTNHWLFEMEGVLGPKIHYVLVGNKVDLIEDVGEVVDQEEVIEFANYNKLVYRETSAKTGLNIDILFEDLIKNLIKKKSHDVNVMKSLWEKK